MEFHELQSIVESTARSLQALSDDVSEMRLNVDAFVTESRAATSNSQAERAELRAATLGIANLLSSLDSDRPTILKKLNSIDGKLDQLLERDNG